MINHLLYIIECLIRNIPSSLGRRIRYIYYKSRLASCGKNVQIDIGVIFENPKSIKIGDNVWLDNYCILIGGIEIVSKNIFYKTNPSFSKKIGQIYLDGNNHIAPFVVLQGHGGISIGKNVTVASGAKIYSFSHHYRNLEDSNDKKSYYFSSMSKAEDQYFLSAPVVIGDGSAIGLNCVVLPGSTIPDNTWIGVSTYTSGEYEEGAVYTTEPAKFNKYKTK